MVLCEAARATAPATTSCAGLPSVCGGGGGLDGVGGGGAVVTVAESVPCKREPEDIVVFPVKARRSTIVKPAPVAAVTTPCKN